MIMYLHHNYILYFFIYQYLILDVKGMCVFLKVYYSLKKILQISTFFLNQFLYENFNAVCTDYIY